MRRSRWRSCRRRRRPIWVEVVDQADQSGRAVISPSFTLCLPRSEESSNDEPLIRRSSLWCRTPRSRTLISIGRSPPTQRRTTDRAASRAASARDLGRGASPQPRSRAQVADRWHRPLAACPVPRPGRRAGTGRATRPRRRQKPLCAGPRGPGALPRSKLSQPTQPGASSDCRGP